MPEVDTHHPRDEAGFYPHIDLEYVKEQSKEWRDLVLDVASKDAADIAHQLERLHSNATLSDREVGQEIGELEERLAWLMSLLGKAKLARFVNDESSDQTTRETVDVQTDKL